MAIRRTTKVDAGFSMSSMTDIVFLLLIFFLVTSTLVNPNAIKLLLPKSAGQVAAKPMATVSIVYHEDEPCTYHVNGAAEPVLIEDLGEALAAELADEEAEADPNDPSTRPTFSIHADEKIPFGDVVAVMNIAKERNYRVIAATRAK